jgi:hypothetical protein
MRNWSGLFPTLELNQLAVVLPADSAINFVAADLPDLLVAKAAFGALIV